MTAQFGDPQPAPHLTKDCNSHYQWSRAVWRKSCCYRDPSRSCPARAKGKILLEGEEVNRKSWGQKDNKVQLSSVLLDI